MPRGNIVLSNEGQEVASGPQLEGDFFGMLRRLKPIYPGVALTIGIMGRRPLITLAAASWFAWRFFDEKKGGR